MSHSASEDRAVHALLDQGLCTSKEEADAMVSAMLALDPSSLESKEAFVESMQSCFDVEPDVMDTMFQVIAGETASSEHDKDCPLRKTSVLIESEEDDDGMYIKDGECELCEREIPLTRHHLIPRSTWPRLEVKILHALEALERNNEEKAINIMGEGLAHLLEDYDTNLPGDRSTQRQYTKQQLQRVCLICRHCHNAVHRAHDNLTLALEYNSIDKLLQDEAIYKFCKWASKQKVSQKYGSHR